MPDPGWQPTNTAMISALFHFERRGHDCIVTCSLLKGWEMHFRTANEFILWFKAHMEAGASQYYEKTEREL